MKLITMPIYNRPFYLRKCLEALAKCRGISDYTILASVDASPKVGEVYTLLKAFRACPTRIYVNERTLGCNDNVYQSLNWAAREADYFIYLEDDILLAPSAIEYFEFCDKEYAQKDIFAVCAYSREKCVPNDYGLVKERDTFYPWGMAFWADRFEKIKADWSSLSMPPIIVEREKDGKDVVEKYNYLSWDYYVKWVLRGGKPCVFPTLSQSKNIGEFGVHTPSVDFHKQKHTLEKWAGEVDKIEFRTEPKLLTCA